MPVYILTAPAISEAEVEIHLVPEGISEAFQARCTFNATHAEGVRFNVSWYFDGEFHSSVAETLENIQKTFIYLQRNNFKTLGRNVSRLFCDIFPSLHTCECLFLVLQIWCLCFVLGFLFQISCEVHMLNNDGSIAQSRISSEKFLGIKVNGLKMCIQLSFCFIYHTCMF